MGFGCEACAYDGAPVVCYYYCLLVFLQELLAYADDELAERFEHFIWTVRGEAVRATVTGEIDGNEDGVLLEGRGLEEVSPYKERIGETYYR